MFKRFPCDGPRRRRDRLCPPLARPEPTLTYVSSRSGIRIPSRNGTFHTSRT